jgi:ABC-type multidrug transport system fused ATPase/permease subunit
MNAQQLKKILNLFGENGKKQVVSLLLMMLLISVLVTLGVGAIPAFIILIGNPQKIASVPYVGDFLKEHGILESGKLLLWGSGFLLGLFIVKNLIISVFTYFRIRFVFRQQYLLELRLFKAYMNLPYHVYMQRNSSDLLRNITQEVTIITNQLMIPMIAFFSDLITVLFILIMLLTIEPTITIITFFTLGLSTYLFIWFTSKKMKKYGALAQDYRSEKIKAVNEGLGAFKDAFILQKQQYFVEKLRSSSRKTAVMETNRNTINFLPSPFIETVAVSSMLLIAVILYFQNRDVQSIIPVLSLFGAASIKLMPSVRDIAKAYSNFKYNVSVVDVVHDEIVEMERIARPISDEKALPFNNNILVRNVSFNYPNQTKPAIENINLDIPFGATVGFVGPSGSGKTTIVDLILGLIKPATGKVTVDGKDISAYAPQWQKNVGYIPQSIYLIDDSIKRNIAFGIPTKEIDEKKLNAAIEKAQLTEFVQNLPDGVESVVGERGTRLSGGQRQRIGIARALYNDPKVLFLDEATSALDNLTEKQVMESLDHLKGSITIIMIAHRLSTVRNCDKLYMFKAGKLIGDGTYNELAEHNQEFRKLTLVS